MEGCVLRGEIYQTLGLIPPKISSQTRWMACTLLPSWPVCWEWRHPGRQFRNVPCLHVLGTSMRQRAFLCEHQRVQGSTFFRSWHRAGLSQMFRVRNHLSRPGWGPQSCAHPTSVPWMSGPPITLDGNSSGSFSFKRALLLPSLSLHPGTFKPKSGITLCRHSESEYV